MQSNLIKYILGHFVVIILAYIAFALATDHYIIPLQCNLNNWDVWHYITIKESGYFYSPLYQSNVAFFPGFPYLWKFSHLNTFGIIFLNIGMFFTGMFMMARKFSFSAKELLLALSIPSFFFMYVPYSEALFFLTSVLILVGLKKKDNRIVFLGLFLSSITRSAANIFLPAIIIMEFISNESIQQRVKNVLQYALAALAGIAVVVAVHYYQTGTAFGFFQTQKHWGHELQGMKWPFSSWGDVTRLDGSALAVGLLAIGVVLFWLFKWLKKQNFVQDRAVIFAALYIAGLGFFALFFKGGVLFSLNRHILATAFFVMFLLYCMRTFPLNIKTVALLFLGLTLFWQLFNAFGHISTMLSFTLVTLYFIGFLLVKSENVLVRNLAFVILYATGIFLQIKLLFMYINCDWVG